MISTHKSKIGKIISSLIKSNRSDDSLYQKTVKGGFWVFTIRIIGQLFNIGRLIIIARILAPSDFGLMGIALLIMMILETFSQTGFQQALIQKKKNIESYLDVVWTVLILRGLVLFGILYFCAPYAATFFNIPQAKSIIQIVGFSIILQSLTNIGVIYFQKELEFNKQFIYQLSGTLADFIVAVSAAFLLKSVWALVFGILVGNFVRFIVSYLVHPYRPHLSFDLEKIKELFGFGKWILGSSILVFLLTQGDDIFVGKFLGVIALGFYQMAYRISNIPATEISHLIATVIFPAYSKIQDALPRLREAYLKVLQLTVFLSFPIAGLIFVLAPDFTKIFLGEKWMPMVPAMQVLALYGILRAIGATTGVVFMAVGKPEIRTKTQFAALVLLAILIYPLTMRFGILGTSMAVTGYALIINFYVIYRVLNIIKISKSDYGKLGKIIIFPLIGTLVIIIITFFLKIHLDISIVSFLLVVITGMFIYLLVICLFDKLFSYGSRQPIKKQLRFF